MPNRIVEVRIESSAFDTTQVRLRVIEGREEIGRLFDFTLEAVVLDPATLDVEAWLGADASLVFELDGVEVRRISGMLAEVEDLLVTETEFRVIRARLLPRAHRLALVETQEVFVDTSVPDLIEKKIGLVGLGDDFELRLLEKYPVREFILQYAETDLAFVSRLAEHLGLSFLFEESDGRDKLVLTDHASGFGHAEGFEKISFRPRGDKADVHGLKVRRRVAPTHFSVRDYNYRTPDLNLFASQEIEAYGGGVDEFGVHSKTPQESQWLAKVRAEACQSTQTVFEGVSDLPVLRAGARFTIEGHPILHDVEVLVTTVRHHASQVALNTGASGKQGYENTFTAIAADVNYRPARTTPRPRMHGIYSAITEKSPGSTGKYANVDANGRYTVRFLLDSAGGDRKTSHPIRMAQPHAGPDGGLHFPIRPDAEVLVAFVNGDPNRPIIVGAVPNTSTPSVVANRNPTVNRIQSASGITIDMGDGR